MVLSRILLEKRRETKTEEESILAKLPCRANFSPSDRFLLAAVHVSTLSLVGVYPLAGHLPQGHQTAEPALGSGHGRPEAVRLRLGQTSGQR